VEWVVGVNAAKGNTPRNITKKIKINTKKRVWSGKKTTPTR